MKTKVMSLIIGLLLVSTSVFAQQNDVFIDLNGDIELGADAQGRLEVQGDNNRDGIVGVTGGTGKAIYGRNDDQGYAGYFQGHAEITGNLNVQGAILGGESDPTVNALGKAILSCTDGQIVQWNNSVWECASAPSGGAEDDPQVGTLTAGQWCTTDGTQVNCTSNAPSGGGPESDPIFTAWNKSTGISINKSQITDFIHQHQANDIQGGLMENYLEIASHLKVSLYINTEEDYRINGATVLAVPSLNTFVGINAGNTIAGSDNSFFGYNAGSSNQSYSNTFIGSNAGQLNSLNSNTFVGNKSGQTNQFGAFNTFIGDLAGQNNQYGSGNVFIGNNAGMNEGGSNILYIANSATSNPLIHGDFASNTVTINNILKLNPIDTATAPTCDATTGAGTLYHNTSTALCWCSGSGGWVNISGVDNNLCQ